MNLGDISTSSFGTPLPANGTPDFDDSPIALPRFTATDGESGDEQDAAPPSPLDDKAPAESKETDVDATPQRIPERNRTQTPKGGSEPPTPSRRPKIQITMETETIIVSAQHPSFIACWLILGPKAKIWTTIGDLIEPGYQYPGEGKTLRAKETMCALLWVVFITGTDEHNSSALRTLASKTPAPSSPTGSSLSSFSTAQATDGGPTAQQIQIAQLLLALLMAQPSYTLPMNRLKDIMTGNAGATGAPHTRALYACVAKRLMKIERGKGEQSVRFDI